LSRSTAHIRVTRRFDRRPAVVAIAGEVDLATAPEMGAALDDALDVADDVVLDLSNTTFMDSSGIHTLFSGRNRAEALGRRLTIVCPPGAVRRLFDITGYSEHLALHDAPLAER
jgi:anti-sigma B factor antagonist